MLTTVLQKCENKTFNQCVEHAKLIEQLSSDAQDMKSDMTTHSYKVTTRNTEKVPANYVCIRCGAKAKHLAKNCFATKLQCNNCKKMGHLSKVCKKSVKSHLVSSCDNGACARQCATFFMLELQPQQLIDQSGEMWHTSMERYDNIQSLAETRLRVVAVIHVQK